MKVCVTGATGFVGARVARALAQRGDEVRVVYRNPERLKALNGVPYRRTRADVLDYRALRRALRGSEMLFHVAGYVASSPIERVWQLNAEGPDHRGRGRRGRGSAPGGLDLDHLGHRDRQRAARR